MYSSQKEEPGLPVSAIYIWEEQHKDPEISKRIQSLEEKDSSVQGIYVPVTLIPNILQHHHVHTLSGHLGIFKTYQRSSHLLAIHVDICETICEKVHEMSNLEK